jgi:hypothetical protein
MQMLLIVGFVTGGFWFIAGPVYFIGENLIGTAISLSHII